MVVDRRVGLGERLLAPGFVKKKLRPPEHPVAAQVWDRLSEEGREHARDAAARAQVDDHPEAALVVADLQAQLVAEQLRGVMLLWVAVLVVLVAALVVAASTGWQLSVAAFGGFLGAGIGMTVRARRFDRARAENLQVARERREGVHDPAPSEQP